VDLEKRVMNLEKRVAELEAVEHIRVAIVTYARALDEGRPELLEDLFTSDAMLHTTPWGNPVQGKEKVIKAFKRYMERFHSPRRYFANEEINVNGETAQAFSYWLVTQERGGDSIIGWGTYRWDFRNEDGRWRISRFLIDILTMTTLEKGWSGEDKIMSY
jgi:ketosteroid isomerase-like protein